MRLSYLSYSFSLAMFYFGILLLIPIIVSVFFQEWNAILPFVVASVTSFALSLMFRFFIKGTRDIKSINDIKKSEGLCITILSWIFAGILASIPYLFFGISPVNAFFESSSGITATGATILSNYDYPNTLFFWRAFSQWLGGMGIIVLFIAILPQFAVGGRQLFFAETPGPTDDCLTPRIKNTAASLWKVYFGMTILEILLLKYLGLDYFDAICKSFATLSGGGFTSSSSSMITYSPSILWIVFFFMFFAGASYNLQYKAWTKLNPCLLFKNEEFRTYFMIAFGTGLLLCLSLFFNSHFSLADSFTHSFFQVSSVISTTGFCSSDFASWDYVSKALLLIVMLAGSCASSAGGGIKIMRWLLILKIMKTEFAKILHPKAVFNIKIGNYSVPKDILHQTLMFVFFYFAILILSIFLVAIIEKNTAVAITGAISSIGNIGPGFGHIIGPLGSYESLNSISKMIFTLDMYIGRLELIPFLVLFQKDIWHLKR